MLDGQQGTYYYPASNPNGYTTNVGDITGVTAGVGLSGGGTSGTVTLTVDLSELTDMTAAMVGTDEFIVLDASADRRKAANEIGLSIFNNDAGFTTNVGDITGVTAGSYLTGGGTSGTVTLNVDATTTASGSKIVARDGNGYVFATYYNSAGTFSTTGITSGMARFTGTNGTDTYGRSYTAQAAATLLSGSTMNIAGNASTATTLQTARTINGVSFNGSANITVADATKLPLAGGTLTGDLLINSANAEINLQAGTTGTNGAVNWTFNTDSTNYASLQLPYDTRATTGFHIDSGYPITIDATTQINFAISGTTGMRYSSSGLSIGSEVVLSESTDRADLLQISSTTSGWGGLQIRNSSNEGRWSFMTDGEQAGIYNDEDNQWHILMTEAAGIALYYSASVKLATTSAGVNITGTATATEFSGPLSGNATTATTLATARTINGVSFDGSANITVADATKLPLTGGTLTGDVVISKADAKVRLYDSTGTSGNNPFVEFDTTANQGIAIELNVYDTELPVAGYGLVVGPSTTNTQFPTTGTLSFNVLGEMYTGGTTLGSLNKVFHDGYHPNADTLTTARTINGVSFNGSANITVADATKLPLTGGTLSGDLTIPDKIIHAGDTNTSIRFPAVDTVAIETSGAERMRINSVGNVNIGRGADHTDSTARLAVFNSGASESYTIRPGTNVANQIDILSYNYGTATYLPVRDVASSWIWFSGTAGERARIDTSGNLLVGKTSLDVGVVGQELRSSGYMAATRDGATVGSYTRLNSDGTILEFRKDSTTVGSIGTYSSRIYIGTGDTGIGTSSISDSVFPVTAVDGTVRDDAINLGITDARWKDLYLSGAVNANTGTFTGTTIAATFNATSTTNGGFQGIDADSNTSPSFTWSADLNTGMYRATTDRIGFTAGGNNEFLIYTSYTYSPGSSRAPIFYDSNSTAYYINPNSTTTSGNFAGTLVCKNVDENVYSNSGTTLNPNLGAIQYKTLAANTTFTDSVDSGESMTLRLNGGATYTVTWPTMTWITSGGNVAPTLNGTQDVLVFWKINTNLYGAYVGYGA